MKISTAAATFSTILGQFSTFVPLEVLLGLDKSGLRFTLMSRRYQAEDLQTYPFVIVPKAFFSHKPSVNAIAAYLAIKHFAAKTGKSDSVSVNTLAALVGLAPNTFKKGVAELTKKGLLHVHKQTKKTGSGKRQSLPNLYVITNLRHRKEDEF